MLRVLLIDCKDSFVYNLVQILRESTLCTFDIVSVECIPFEDLSKYDSLLLSPGPAKPEDFPELNRCIQQCKKTHTILGVCLGHQALAMHFGATLTQMTNILHGHKSQLIINKRDNIFRDIRDGSAIARYHSWVIKEDTLPKTLEVLARTTEEEGGHIMAIRHKILPIWGLQFHPESMITENGKQYLLNFLQTSIEYKKQNRICTSRIL